MMYINVYSGTIVFLTLIRENKVILFQSRTNSKVMNLKYSSFTVIEGLSFFINPGGRLINQPCSECLEKNSNFTVLKKNDSS